MSDPKLDYRWSYYKRPRKGWKRVSEKPKASKKPIKSRGSS